MPLTPWEQIILRLTENSRQVPVGSMATAQRQDTFSGSQRGDCTRMYIQWACINSIGNISNTY